jgi:hypothetical protein
VAITSLVSTAWWRILWAYLSPTVEAAGLQITGGARRAAFVDAKGHELPFWERALLTYYAVAITLVVLTLILIACRPMLQRMRPGLLRNDRQQWKPQLWLVLIVALIPTLVFAARLVPDLSEYGDRLSTFLFLPFSFLVAAGIVYWSWSAPRRHVVRARLLVMVLVPAMFVGGYMVGSGPDWQWLPGKYRVSADHRAMDAETIAAVHWAYDALPAGSRVGADRASSALFLSQTQLWPIVENLGVTSMYFSDEWGPEQSDAARTVKLRYLYVDQRLADDLPAFGEYFRPWEALSEVTPQLTRDQLTKFDSVPGIQAVYRHGPIAIYDLSGLGVPELGSAGVGATRSLDIPLQLVIGLLVGLALVFVGRSRAGRIVVQAVKSLKDAAGRSLTFAVGIGALCFASFVLLLAHIWLGPTVFVSMGLIVLLFNRHGCAYLAKKLRDSVARLHWRSIAASIVVALIVSAAIAQAVLDAYAVNVSRVRSILDDPAAVHVSAQSPTRTEGGR